MQLSILGKEKCAKVGRDSYMLQGLEKIQWLLFTQFPCLPNRGGGSQEHPHLLKILDLPLVMWYAVPVIGSKSTLKQLTVKADGTVLV